MIAYEEGTGIAYRNIITHCLVLIDASNKGGQQPDGGDRHGEVAIPRQERGVAQAKEAAWVLCLSTKAENKHN